MDVQLPPIDGLTDRAFEGDADYEALAVLFNACLEQAHDQWLVTAEEIKLSFENTETLDVVEGFRFVERDGSPVGYVVVRWMEEDDGRMVYRHMCRVLPSERRLGIGTALLRASQDHLRRVAGGHAAPTKVYRTDAGGADVDTIALLVENGYAAVETHASLTRPNLDDIPEATLPPGVEVRPVEESQLRQIFDADTEAFRDHWGFVEPTEGDWVQFLEFKHRDESLWKVAWHGDEVVGQVRTFINEDENRDFGRKRGWTEFISTAREWRGRGIATALICESLAELGRRGMEEAALGVHVGNPHGAFRLYQSLGFEVTSRGATYEKPLESDLGGGSRRT